MNDPRLIPLRSDDDTPRGPDWLAHLISIALIPVMIGGLFVQFMFWTFVVFAAVTVIGYLGPLLVPNFLKLLWFL